TLHSVQTQKARNSAKIENVMLRRATTRPRRSQNASSSGCQSSIHGLVPIPTCHPLFAWFPGRGRGPVPEKAEFQSPAGCQENVAKRFRDDYGSNTSAVGTQGLSTGTASSPPGQGCIVAMANSKGP